jgi:hypothetical protein
MKTVLLTSQNTDELDQSAGITSADDATVILEPAADDVPDPAEAQNPQALVPTDPNGPLLSTGQGQAFLDRWSALQIGFLDDPPGGVAAADALLVDVIGAYRAAFDDRRGALTLAKDAAQDTEQHRLAMLRYRALLRSLLA